MITKALLYIWVGFGYGENQSVTVLDSLIECEAAREAIIASNAGPRKGVHCIPYTFFDGRTAAERNNV